MTLAVLTATFRKIILMGNGAVLITEYSPAFRIKAVLPSSKGQSEVLIAVRNVGNISHCDTASCRRDLNGPKRPSWTTGEDKPDTRYDCYYQ